MSRPGIGKYGRRCTTLRHEDIMIVVVVVVVERKCLYWDKSDKIVNAVSQRSFLASKCVTAVVKALPFEMT